MNTELIKQLREGCVGWTSRHCGATHADQSGPVNEAETDRLMALAADEIERLERNAKTSAELRKGVSWTCSYCGAVTRDRSTAMLHPAMCPKWPYRLLADAVIEMVRANDVLGGMLNNEVNYRQFLNPTPEDTALDKVAARCEVARKAFEAMAREAADAAIERENTEGD